MEVKAGIVLLAAFWDYLIGDPKQWLHPVQIIGGVVAFFTRIIITYLEGRWLRRIAGVVLTLAVIFGSAFISWWAIHLITNFVPIMGIITQIMLLGSCLAGKSLRSAAMEVIEPLQRKNLAQACMILSQYVGRDTADLEEEEILRAVLETVSENTPDGVTAPLFYAMIGGVPMALAYKAASTLDSMIGYRREPYTDIGWFAAQLEDRLTWLPCRLTFLTILMLSGRPRDVWRICCRDAPQDPSPNSGWSEGVYAATLKVQLGGVNRYKGEIREKPLLGDNLEAITPDKIFQALQLTRHCVLLWLFIYSLLLIWLKYPLLSSPAFWEQVKLL